MNKKGLLYFILLVLFFGCSSEESVKNSLPAEKSSVNRVVTFENLFGVSALGNRDAWIVGFEAIILHTGDGGLNWEYQKSPESTDLYDVLFVDSVTGWISGKSGTMLHTTDGGKHWLKQKTGTEQRLFDVYFISNMTGWAVGTWGTILHTTDGGKSWMKQGSGEDRYYNGVWFIDEQRGWIVGEYSLIMHTENGGRDWVKQECEEIIPEEPELDFAPPPPHLYGVYFVSPDIGWATGLDGIVIKTEDGGKNWKRLTTGAEYAIYKISVIDNKGFAIGDRGEYLVSRDGGNTWEKRDGVIRTKFWLKDMVFTDESFGWIVGANGTILNTIDGGRNWNMISGAFIQ